MSMGSTHAIPPYSLRMTSEQGEYPPSRWERIFASAAVGLIALGVLGIVVSLAAAAASWKSSLLTVAPLIVLISLPIAILLIIAVVVIGVVRRRRN